MAAAPSAASAPDVTRLRRPVLVRLVAGTRFQPWLTVGALINLTTIVALAATGSAASLAAAVPGLLWWVAWLPGVTAGAEVDDIGVRWRYFARVDLAWTEIERVRFGVRPGVTAGAPRATIWLRAGGRDRVLAPALVCSRDARTEFGRALLAQARAHKVRVEIPRNDPHWSDLAR